MAQKGRPTKITEQKIKEISDLIKMGNFMETACAYSGIDSSTARRWIKRGQRELDRVEAGEGRKIKKSEQLFADFCTTIKKSEAEAEIRALAKINEAERNHWQATAWRMERRFPERWGNKQSVELAGKDGGPIEVEDARERLKEKLQNLVPSDEKDE